MKSGRKPNQDGLYAKLVDAADREIWIQGISACNGDVARLIEWFGVAIQTANKAIKKYKLQSLVTARPKPFQKKDEDAAEEA